MSDELYFVFDAQAEADFIKVINLHGQDYPRMPYGIQFRRRTDGKVELGPFADISVEDLARLKRELEDYR